MTFHETFKYELFDAVISDDEWHSELFHHSPQLSDVDLADRDRVEQMSVLFSKQLNELERRVNVDDESEDKKIDCVAPLESILGVIDQFSLFSNRVIADYFGEMLLELLDVIALMYQRHLVALSNMSHATVSVKISARPCSVRSIETAVLLINQLLGFYETIKHEPLSGASEKLIDRFADQLELLLEIRYEVSDQTHAYAAELMALETLLTE